MDEIQITVSKIGIAKPDAPADNRGRKKGSGQIQRFIETQVIPLLDVINDPVNNGIVQESVCKASWARYECRFPELEFTFYNPHKVMTEPGRLASYASTLGQRWIAAKYATRHDVCITRKQQTEDRPAVVEACRNMTGFLGGVR
jgi:hypothetical protein